MTRTAYLEHGKLGAAIGVLAKKSDVFAPVDMQGDGNIDFKNVDSADSVVLKPKKTKIPLKALFLPLVENLCTYCTGEGRMDITPVKPMERDRIVIGALACDVTSLVILDKVFLSGHTDHAYMERRDRTTIFALSCEGEGPECFCASLDIDPIRPIGADVHMTPAGKGYVLEAVTKKGEGALISLGSLVKKVPAKEAKQAATFTSTSRSNVSLKPPAGGWEQVWETQVWTDSSSRCLGCGICTVMCPTCHCFDVQDEKRGNEGTRFRTWDTCMAADFTLMGHGDNPRTERKARVRQRYMHKLVYYQENNGVIACVGCGRCAKSCPNRTGIDEIAAAIREAGERDE